MHPASLLTCAQGAHLSFASFAESTFADQDKTFAFRLGMSTVRNKKTARQLNSQSERASQPQPVSHWQSQPGS